METKTSGCCEEDRESPTVPAEYRKHTSGSQNQAMSVRPAEHQQQRGKLAVTVSDNEADGGGVGQGHHGNHAVVAAVLSVDMEVALVEDARHSFGGITRDAWR